MKQRVASQVQISCSNITERPHTALLDCVVYVCLPSSQPVFALERWLKFLECEKVVPGVYLFTKLNLVTLERWYNIHNVYCEP